MKPKVIVILGPTATGKSALGVSLAKRLGGEIISGDSMLVFRGMDIGTAKPERAILDSVPHHLIDILEPNEPYSAADFQTQADALIASLQQQNKWPIVVGGTGLYIQALLEKYEFAPVAEDAALRARLANKAAQEGNASVWQELAALDPLTAARLHVNDVRRVIRAIEVAHAGGAVSQRRGHPEAMRYDAWVIGLTMERSKLYARINQRVDEMVAQGLIEEVAALLKQGVSPTAQSMKGIGYKEIVAYLAGELDYQTAVDKVKQATRNFAKRQFTWYRRMQYIEWYDVSAYPDTEALADVLCAKLADRYKQE